MTRNGIRRLPIIALIAVLLQLAGCYYVQAIRGHSDLMSRRRPLAELLADESLPASLRDKLALVSEARDFAVAKLLLPDNESYRSYADLQRDFVVWNVFAAAEFSLQPKNWCYPVAGCVAYRGYFSEKAARKLAGKLARKGFDVAVGGVAAYSTLGHFADPVLNTMMNWSDVELVSTMFHELAHQKLYIKGDSEFNESFATAVADIGIERWLEETGEADRLVVYRERQSIRRMMLDMVRETRNELAKLYASDADDEQKRRRKRDILDTLSADAERLIEENGAGLNNWLAPPLNNARLISMNLYEGRVDAFKAIFARCKMELACFYERSARIGKMKAKERARALEAGISDPMGGRDDRP